MRDKGKVEVPMFRILDFRDCQHHGSIIADRVWNAWWKGAGQPLSAVEFHMTEMANDDPLPTALVAQDDEGYVGSAFVIRCDLEERAHCIPWIAAVWVDPTKRRKGAGSALVIEGAKIARLLGYPEAYVCCLPHLESFYETIGFTLVERDVGAHSLSVLGIATQEARSVRLDPEKSA
jgi:N-acetylglutamate synthase-like GNAT family acetyltransferase